MNAGDVKTVREIEEINESEVLHVVARALNDEKKKRYPSEMTRRSRAMESPLLVLGDSYKAGHFKMYKEAKLMCAYGEFREGMTLNGIKDPRIVVYGMRHIIDQLVSRVITQNDVDWAKTFYDQHGSVGSKYAYPAEMFDKIRTLGHFPVKIEALPEGSVVLPHTPVFFITAEKEFSRFCTFLETVFTMVWYPSSVATLSKHTKCLIENAFDLSVLDGKNSPLLMSRLHDFGFRGCTCVEQSVIGGSAHLLNFDGSDTMSACFHVQYHLNGGRAIGSAIPATEHSVMTSFEDEMAAITNLIHEYPDQPIACVMDSYNYDHALEVILPKVKDKIGNGTFVIRPDSGDSVIQVLKALRAAVAAGFGREEVEVDGKKYIVLKNVAVIQGDGINYGTVKEILDAVHEAGFSAQNVAFGMGGGLLQKLDRDTLSFATKLCYVQFQDGTSRDVMKAPYGVPEKWSSPGLMKVMNNNDTHHTVIPIEQEKDFKGREFTDSMKTVYDNGKLDETYMTEEFDVIRKRISNEWAKCESSFFNKESGEWKNPRDATLTAKAQKTAGKINTTISGYRSRGAEIFKDVVTQKVTGVIEKREALLARRKALKEIIKIQQNASESGDSSTIQEKAAKLSENLKKSQELTEMLRNRAAAAAAATTKSQYPDPAELEYPLMRLNALLDNIASKLDK
jgi:nicotinamide phosphoribosyltransferase